MPRTGLEPARLAARAPETRASTIPPPGLDDLIRADVKGRVQEASAAEIFAFSDAKVGTFFETCKFLACFL